MMNTLLHLILRQTVMDFRKRYLGTALGGLWAVISPLMTIALIYFVMSYGLKAGVMGHVSFVNWLVPGMLAWFFMSESLMMGCSAIIENCHLVTKVIFPVRILPVCKILSCLPVHLFLLGVFVTTLFFEGSGTRAQWWQLLYYIFCATVFCISFSLITSACMVFVRDISNIVGVFIQIFFWATPIFWDPAILAHSRMRFLLLSPFNYIVQGYRDVLFNGLSFWNKPLETGVFWFITVAIALIGWKLFSKTRPHFADVL